MSSLWLNRIYEKSMDLWEIKLRAINECRKVLGPPVLSDATSATTSAATATSSSAETIKETSSNIIEDLDS